MATDDVPTNTPDTGQPDTARRDQEQGDELTAARQHLMDRGAATLPLLPWMRPGMPPSDVSLIRYTLWQASQGGLHVPEDLYAALHLLDSARAEMDGLEAGLLFLARAEGLTWPQIAPRLGVRTPQAAQQRFDRVSARTEADEGRDER